MSALKIENFEITSYNGLIKLAGTTSNDDVAELLRLNLTDEMETDQLLAAMSTQTNPAVSKASRK